jgi:amino acid adenylation domain-containing protein
MTATLAPAVLSPEEKRARLAELLRQRAGPVRQFPLSFAQQRLWFLDRLEPGNAAYNIVSALRMRGPLDAAAMERAIATLVDRHESLRTVFRVVDGSPVQVVVPARPLRVPVEAADAPEAARDAEALRLVGDELARPFDLARGPIFRARLLRLGADDHVLLLCMHHIVTDGWSLGVLFRELCALYAAYLEGREAELPALPIQYADYAVWQRGHLQGAVLDEQLGYWRTKLAGAPALLELPLDRPRPAVQTHAGGLLRTVFPPAFGQALRDTARRLESTQFMVALAAFNALLARWSGRDDLVVGTPAANRPRQETEGIVGLFLNTLALRTDLSGDPTFAEMVARVRETTVGAYAHQEVPFERLVDALGVERALSHAPVVQVHFVLHTEPSHGIVLGPLKLSLVEPEPAATQYELSFSLRERPQGMEVDVEYNRDLFDRATVERMTAHFHTLFQAAATDPDLPLSRLPLSSAEEKGASLAGGRGAEMDPPAVPVHALVSAQAARTPDAIAVASGGESITYAELEARSNRLARRLVRLGIGRGARVAISMERSVALLVAMHGVWKAGAAYVPIDPAYPEERRAYMLDDCGAAVVLTDAASAAGLPATEAQTVVVDALDLSEEDASALEVSVDGDDLAYVIYTSGSTGRPKGVMVPHGAVANFLASMAREPGIGADDVMVAVTSLSFDIAVLELLLPLTAGAQVVVATREEALDPRRLAALLRASGATMMQATPATWRMLAQSGWEGDPRLAILCGGEALPPELARALLPRGRVLWNLYGPTETTIWSAAQRVEDAARVGLGEPIANTQLYVLDAAGEPCPPGVPGELFIGGHGVVRGYFRRPGLTAERFVPDAFGGRTGARLYRTGDRVRRKEVRKCESAEVRKWNGDEACEASDGSTLALSHSRTFALEFLGRMDFQVKLRGFRIELAEVEAVLAEQPGVRDAVAGVRDEAAGDARLVAYIVADGETPQTDVLRAALAARLPDYMVPGAFVVLDALPLTPNGKVDRRALPDPAAYAPARAAVRVPPRTPMEREVAAVWREVLGGEEVSVDDNFFNLGGHSLLLAQVAARLEERRGREVPLLDLFRHTTVAAQAAYLEGDAGKDAAPAPRNGGQASSRLAARPVRPGR